MSIPKRMLIELIKMTAFPNKGAFCSREGSNNAFLISLVVLYAVIEEVITNMHASNGYLNSIDCSWRTHQKQFLNLSVGVSRAVTPIIAERSIALTVPPGGEILINALVLPL